MRERKPDAKRGKDSESGRVRGNQKERERERVRGNKKESGGEKKLETEK